MATHEVAFVPDPERRTGKGAAQEVKLEGYLVASGDLFQSLSHFLTEQEQESQGRLTSYRMFVLSVIILTAFIFSAAGQSVTLKR